MNRRRNNSNGVFPPAMVVLEPIVFVVAFIVVLVSQQRQQQLHRGVAAAFDPSAVQQQQQRQRRLLLLHLHPPRRQTTTTTTTGGRRRHSRSTAIVLATTTKPEEEEEKNDELLSFEEEQRRRPQTTISRNDEDSDSDSDNDNDLLRNNLGREWRGLQSTGMKKTIEVGDTVVCKREMSEMGIFEGKAYELRSIHAQAFNAETQRIEKIPLQNLDESFPRGHDRYITLYSPLYHKNPVVVTPEEVGLTSVRSEIVDSVWLAIPGFFWVYVCYTFYSVYHERTGGDFIDAFLGK